MDQFPPYPPGEDDDHDDLAALDFSAPDEGSGSGFDAFDDYTAYADDNAEDGWSTADPTAEDEGSDEPETPIFVVTNPPGTVSVSAFIDGRVHRVDLSAKVADMTESELADEIVVIAGLARDKARSAQFVFISEVMQQLGPNAAETNEFLGRTMGLPSPDEAQNEEARVFSTRYASNHE